MRMSIDWSALPLRAFRRTGGIANGTDEATSATVEFLSA